MGGLAAIALLAVGLLVERQTASHTWHAFGDEGVIGERFIGFFRGWETLVNREDIRVWSRFWSIPPHRQGLRIDLEARLEVGQPGSEWHLFSPEFVLEYHSDEGTPFTRVHTPAGGGSQITRRINTEAPIAGRTFRARLELRAPEALSTTGCQGILLREVRGGYLGECLAVDLTPVWQPFELVWTPPAEAQSPIIRIELRIPSIWYDVRRVSLEEYVAGEWLPIEPLEPTGVWFSLALPGVERAFWPSRGFIPTDTWQTYSLDFSTARLEGLGHLRTEVRVEDGLSVAVRNVRVATLSGEATTPLPSPPRQQLWYGDQNLAGHSMAVAGLVLVSAAQSGGLGLVGALVSLTAVFFTASRAAWLALLVGLPWLLWWACRPAQRGWVFGALIVMIGAVLAAFGTDALGRLQVWQLAEGNTVPRTEIWGFAWDTLTAQPFAGVGEQGFVSAWQAQHPDDRREVPTHAHNLWLQFGAAYGVPGLLAALWLSAGLLVIAWRWGRWRGLGLVVPVLMMQVFDYTLFYAGVLFPLILGLNMLRGERPKG